MFLKFSVLDYRSWRILPEDFTNTKIIIYTYSTTNTFKLNNYCTDNGVSVCLTGHPYFFNNLLIYEDYSSIFAISLILYFTNAELF